MNLVGTLKKFMYVPQYLMISTDGGEDRALSMELNPTKIEEG